MNVRNLGNCRYFSLCEKILLFWCTLVCVGHLESCFCEARMFPFVIRCSKVLTELGSEILQASCFLDKINCKLKLPPEREPQLHKAMYERILESENNVNNFNSFVSFFFFSILHWHILILVISTEGLGVFLKISCFFICTCISKFYF